MTVMKKILHHNYIPKSYYYLITQKLTPAFNALYQLTNLLQILRNAN